FMIYRLYYCHVGFRHLEFLLILFFFFLIRLPLGFTLFPYTTLFRSRVRGRPCTGGGRSPRAPCRTTRSSSCRPLRSSRALPRLRDRKSTRLNSSHVANSYAVFCLKKKIATSAPTRRALGLTSVLRWS